MARDDGGGGGGCGWAVLALFPILAMVGLGAATGQLPGVGRPAEIPPAEILAEGATWPTTAPAPAPSPWPTAAPPVEYRPAEAVPTMAPVYPVYRPAAGDGGTAQSAVVQSPWAEASPAPPSPAWQALGWALVGVVGIGGPAGLGAILYRHVVVTRAIRAAAIGAERPASAPLAPDLAPADPSPAADGATVPIGEYLAQEV